MKLEQQVKDIIKKYSNDDDDDDDDDDDSSVLDGLTTRQKKDDEDDPSGGASGGPSGGGPSGGGNGSSRSRSGSSGSNSSNRSNGSNHSNRSNRSNGNSNSNSNSNSNAADDDAEQYDYTEITNTLNKVLKHKKVTKHYIDHANKFLGFIDKTKGMQKGSAKTARVNEIKKSAVAWKPYLQKLNRKYTDILPTLEYIVNHKDAGDNAQYAQNLINEIEKTKTMAEGPAKTHKINDIVNQSHKWKDHADFLKQRTNAKYQKQIQKEKKNKAQGELRAEHNRSAIAHEDKIGSYPSLKHTKAKDEAKTKANLSARKATIGTYDYTEIDEILDKIINHEVDQYKAEAQHYREFVNRTKKDQIPQNVKKIQKEFGKWHSRLEKLDIDVFYVNYDIAPLEELINKINDFRNIDGRDQTYMDRLLDEINDFTSVVNRTNPRTMKGIDKLNDHDLPKLKEMYDKYLSMSDDKEKHLYYTDYDGGEVAKLIAALRDLQVEFKLSEKEYIDDLDDRNNRIISNRHSLNQKKREINKIDNEIPRLKKLLEQYRRQARSAPV